MELTADAAFAGLGQRLVEVVGFPTVVGMTDRVSVATALAFADIFYTLLVDGVVDRSVATAAARLAERGDVTVPVLWSTPAVSTRTPFRP